MEGLRRSDVDEAAGDAEYVANITDLCGAHIWRPISLKRRTTRYGDQTFNTSTCKHLLIAKILQYRRILIFPLYPFILGRKTFRDFFLNRQLLKIMLEMSRLVRGRRSQTNFRGV